MPNSITLASATLRADGKTVDYVFDVDITPAPANGTAPTEKTNNIPLIGKHDNPGEDKFADHIPEDTVFVNFNSTTNTVTATVVYEGLFHEDQDIEVIGSGTIKVPNLNSGSTAEWINLSSVFSEDINGTAIVNDSEISEAPLLSVKLGRNNNPLSDVSWEVKFTFDDSSGETPKTRDTFRPQFKSIDSTRRLFVKSEDSIDFTGTTVTVTGTLNRSILSSETIEVSIPSGYVFSDSQASARVYGQSTTNNSPTLQVSQLPTLSLRLFPDDIESVDVYGPTCVGVLIDPSESDPGRDALWSRCTVKHTIVIKDSAENIIHLPDRYRYSDDPREGYDTAVSGTSLSSTRDWCVDGMGFAHCIVAVEGSYEWTVEVTNEFGKTKSSTVEFDVLDRSTITPSIKVWYVDSANASDPNQDGSEDHPYESIFDLTNPKPPLLKTNDEVVIVEGHSETMPDNEDWDTAGASNVWIHREDLDSSNPPPAFLQRVHSGSNPPSIFNIGKNGTTEGILIEGIRFVPTTDTTSTNPDPDKFDPGIGFADAFIIQSHRTACVDCTIEGNIDDTNPK